MIQWSVWFSTSIWDQLESTHWQYKFYLWLWGGFEFRSRFWSGTQCLSMNLSWYPFFFPLDIWPEMLFWGFRVCLGNNSLLILSYLLIIGSACLTPTSLLPSVLVSILTLFQLMWQPSNWFLPPLPSSANLFSALMSAMVLKTNLFVSPCWLGISK